MTESLRSGDAITESLLEVDGLRFGPAGVAVTGPVSFRLRSGSVLAVLGPNGAGKTTLFRTILGLLQPVAGSVVWKGMPAHELAPRELARLVAYVPQSPGAAFDFTVEQYVLLGRLGLMGALNAPSREDRAAASAAIGRLGIDSLRGRFLSRVSGGERQLAALARALAQGACALVLDEPVASLDLANQVRVLELLASLTRDGLAIAYSTHDPNHALMAGNEALLMSRDGEPLHGSVGTLIEAGALSRAYGTRVETARTSSGRPVFSAGGRDSR
jgi:iron complex transport system ATP-binding protein